MISEEAKPHIFSNAGLHMVIRWAGPLAVARTTPMPALAMACSISRAGTSLRWRLTAISMVEINSRSSKGFMRYP
jgi:hypothetical protein